MSLKLFIEYFSQPSRAVLSLALQEKIPNTLINIRLSKKDHKTPEFLSQFPLGTVPSMSHLDINISESHAILIYLCENFPVSENWYPKPFSQRAHVNEYLHWHHKNTREAFGTFVFNKLMGPAVYNQPFSPSIHEQCLKRQKSVFRYLESVLQTSYVAKTEFPTIADLSCYCELSQMRIVKFDFTQYTNLVKWMEKIEALPGIQESHKTLNGLLPKMHEKYSQFLVG